MTDDPHTFIVHPNTLAAYWGCLLGPLGLLSAFMSNVVAALETQRANPDGCIRRITEACEQEYALKQMMAEPNWMANWIPIGDDDE